MAVSNVMPVRVVESQKEHLWEELCQLASEIRQIRQELKEAASMMRDVAWRIGPACTPEWARHEIERISRKLEEML